MNGFEQQPEIKEPQILIGETVWSDEYGSSIGKIVYTTEDKTIVKYEDRISFYEKTNLNVVFLPPYLVLVGSLETIVHKY